MINVMGMKRKVQGKQYVHGIGDAVLIFACVLIMALSAGCTRSTTASVTPLISETTSTNLQTVETIPKKDTAVKPVTASVPGTSATTAPAPVLYESIAFGVRVSESNGWLIQKSFDTPLLKVVFGNEKIQAILSVLSPDKTGKAILGELLQGLGNVEVISRTDTTLEVRTRYADSMRTIAHVVREGRFNYLLVFVTPDNGLEQRLDAIASLISSLDYLG